MQIDQDIRRQRIERFGRFAGIQQPRKRRIAQIFKQQKTRFLIRRQNTGGAESKRRELVRDPHKRAHVFPARRGIHQHRAIIRHRHPLVAPERRVFGKRRMIRTGPPDRGKKTFYVRRPADCHADLEIYAIRAVSPTP